MENKNSKSINKKSRFKMAVIATLLSPLIILVSLFAICIGLIFMIIILSILLILIITLPLWIGYVVYKNSYFIEKEENSQKENVIDVNIE